MLRSHGDTVQFPQKSQLPYEDPRTLTLSRNLTFYPAVSQTLKPHQPNRSFVPLSSPSIRARDYSYELGELAASSSAKEVGDLKLSSDALCVPCLAPMFPGDFFSVLPLARIVRQLLSVSCRAA